MEDYIYMSKEGEVFAQRANKGDWWEDCGDDGCDEQKYMVNSRSLAEELQDDFKSRAEMSHSGLQTRLSSTSVSFD